METKEGEKVNFKENFKEYLNYLKKYKPLVAILILTVVLSEVKPILDKYLFKVVIDKGTEFSTGALSIEVFSNLLMLFAFIYLGIILFDTILQWAKINFLNRLESATIYDMKKKYFEHILSLDYTFHTTHKTGSLISKITRGSSAMERMSDVIIFEFCTLSVQLAVAVIALIYLDPSSSLIITLIIISFILFSLFRQKKANSSNLLMNKTEDIERGNVADFFTNMDSIRNYGKEDYIKKRYKDLILKTKANSLFAWNYWRGTSAGQSFILGAGTLVLFYFSITAFLAGEMTLGTLAFIYSTYISLIGPMFMFVNGMRGFSKSMADFQSLFAYGKFHNEIKDKPNAEKLEIKAGKIEFKNVCFNYGKRKVFEDFNLKINPNEKVALVGHSGSGKTTLIKLLYRLYDVNVGEILIDNKNLKDVKQESLRSELSIVPQECILFDDTVFNNIRFSKPKASKEEVMKAIRFAQLDKVIKNFPDKENTIVGERGVKLSGGEKQRVSIARAILANKQVLVLDEATSSLDSETESEIQKDLVRLLEGRTAIMIAHRLSTIMSADKIVVLKNGKIAQMGDHNSLINQPGEYKHLWNLQKGGYIK